MKKIISIIFSFITLFSISQENDAHQAYYFCKNKGQIHNQIGEQNSNVLYLLKSNNGINIQLRETGFSYDLFSQEGSKMTVNRIDVDFAGCNSEIKVIHDGVQPFFENYMIASEEGKTYANIRFYSIIKYLNVYPNIDVVFYAEKDGIAFKYDIIVRPGGDIRDFKLNYKGIDGRSCELDEKLKLKIGNKVIEESIPLSYYASNKKQQDVSFELLEVTDSELTVGFNSLGLNNNLTLIIDPVPNYVWGRYIGDSLNTTTDGVVTDRFGYVYVCGGTQSITNIATSGAYQVIITDTINDAYVTKYNKFGTKLWSTYFGGDNYDKANSIYVDTSFNVFIGGITMSSTGLIDSLGFQDSINGSSDGFLAKFNMNGVLKWATYFGGENDEEIHKLSTDFFGNLYVCGQSNSDSLPILNSFQSINNGNFDGFVAKFDSVGTLEWSSYIGGSDFDIASGIAFGDTSVFVVGTTYSEDFPVSDSVYQDSLNGLKDGFIARFSKSGTMVWNSYFGGENEDNIQSIKVFNNNLFFIGTTDSDSSITTLNAFQIERKDSSDAFISKMNHDGELIWSSYLGGEDVDEGIDLFFELDSNLIIVGTTYSDSLPFIDSNSHQINLYGTSDAFLAKITKDGEIVWSSYYGGDENEIGNGVGVYGNTAIYVVGNTNSDSLLVAINDQNGLNGFNSNTEGFFTKFNQDRTTLPPVGDSSVSGGGGSVVWPGGGTGSGTLIYPYCIGDTVVLTTEGGELGTDAYWVWYEGTCGNSQSIGTGDTLVYVLTSTVTIYLRAESNTNATPCVSFLFSVAPFLELSILSDTSTCLGVDYTLSVSDTGYVSWSGPNGFSSNSLDTTIISITDSSAGWYYIDAINIYGCKNEDSLNLTIHENPTAELTSTDASCYLYNDGAVFTDVLDTASFIFNWITSNNYSDTIIGSNILDSLEAGIYTLILSNEFNCTFIDSIEVYQPNSSLLDTLILATSCNDSTGGISLTLDSLNSPYSIIWMQSNQSGNNALHLGYGWHDVVIVNALECEESHSFFVPNINNLSVEIDSVIPTYCAGTPTGEATAFGVLGTPPYWFEWPSLNSIGATASLLDTGNYIVIVHDAAGCFAYDTVTIVAVHSPEFISTIIPSKCSFPSGEIIVEEDSTYSISFLTGITDEWSMELLETGNYSATISDTFGCIYSLNFFVPIENDLFIEINPSDLILETGEEFVLEVLTNYLGSFSYLWTSSDNLSCSNCENPTLSGMENETIELIVSDGEFCIDTAVINITIENPCVELFVPSHFSPNSDNVNDDWEIIGTCISSFSVKVFNQWGGLIFESNDQTLPWDGTYKGEKVQNGQYVYSINIEYTYGESVQLSNFVTIIDAEFKSQMQLLS